MLQKYDYIIVGQGIIGTILSLKLLHLGKKVLVIDNHHHEASSKIAAGIINPITGRNYVKSWKIEELVLEALSTYDALSAILGKTYLIDREVIRVLHTPKEENAWMQRTGDESYVPYMSSEIDAAYANKGLKSTGTYGTIKQGYQLRIADLVVDWREYLKSKECFLEEKLDHTALSVADKVTYKDYTADKIVFCEGFAVRENPLFSYLPFDPVKGQVLIINAPNLKLNDNYRDKIFVTPLGNDEYWIGSGYNKMFTDVETTEKERERLISVLAGIIDCEYTIVRHIAGIRPATKTRKPLVGQHQEYNNVYVCNGMGAKGSSLGPFFVKELIGFIENGTPLTEEVDIRKYDIE